MTEADAFGRLLTAQYTFRGAKAGLEATLPLTIGERVLLDGVARLHVPWRLPRPVVLRLSALRLVALIHRVFDADQVIELPRAAVRGVVLDGDTVVVTWLTSTSECSAMRVSAWTGPPRMAQPLRDVVALARQLDQWLAPG